MVTSAVVSLRGSNSAATPKSLLTCPTPAESSRNSALDAGWWTKPRNSMLRPLPESVAVRIGNARTSVKDARELWGCGHAQGSGEGSERGAHVALKPRLLINDESGKAVSQCLHRRLAVIKQHDWHAASLFAVAAKTVEKVTELGVVADARGLIQRGTRARSGRANHGAIGGHDWARSARSSAR
eukprot:1446553-Prymnesium_polylepis.1